MAINLAKWKALLQQALPFLSLLTSLTSTPWDNQLVDWLKSVWETPEFLKLYKEIPAATEGDDGAVTMPVMALEQPSPEALALFDKFKTQVGEEKAGNISEFLQMVFEFVAWFKAFQARRQPAAPAGS